MWQTHQETVIFAGLNSATSIEYVQLGYGSSLCLPRGTRCRVVSKFEPHRAAGKTCQMFSPNNPNTWSAQVSSWTTAYRRPWGFGGLGGFLGVLGGFGGGADIVLGCPPYKIFSWTCCYAIHSSLAPYPATRYQLLLVTCKTLLIFAFLFLGGGFGGG